MKSCSGKQQLMDYITVTRVEPLYKDYSKRGGSVLCFCLRHYRASRRYVTNANDMCYGSLPYPSHFSVFCWLTEASVEADNDSVSPFKQHPPS